MEKRQSLREVFDSIFGDDRVEGLQIAEESGLELPNLAAVDKENVLLGPGHGFPFYFRLVEMRACRAAATVDACGGEKGDINAEGIKRFQTCGTGKGRRLGG